MTMKLKIDKVLLKKSMPFKNHYLMEIKCEFMNIYIDTKLLLCFPDIF